MNDPRKLPPPRAPDASAPSLRVDLSDSGFALTGGGEPLDLDEGLVEPGRPSLVGNLIAERYRIERLIGVGGMGAVYFAEHVHMQKPVALKVLHREFVALPEVVARFEREAIAAGRLNDPHVVAATDFGRLPDGSFYLALEYVSGNVLADLLRGGPLGAVRSLKIARQILQAR